MAAWEAAFLPDWKWEAYDKDEDRDGVYFGRVKSPNTYGRWEYGYFTEDQLEKAGAYRVDEGFDDEPGGELFPDGGRQLSQLYETELEALLENDDREGDAR